MHDDLMTKVFENTMRAARAMTDDREPSRSEINGLGARGFVSESPWSSGYSLGDMPSNVLELIVWLQDKLASIPEHCRESAELSIEQEYSYGDSYLSSALTYDRPETDEEWGAREADVRRRAALWAAQREAAARAQYEALKAKFDPEG